MGLEEDGGIEIVPFKQQPIAASGEIHDLSDTFRDAINRATEVWNKGPKDSGMSNFEKDMAALDELLGGGDERLAS